MRSLSAFPMLAAFAGLQQPMPAESRSEAAPPVGFEAISEEQESLADIFFAGRRLGQARIRSKPGSARFDDVAKLVAMLPSLADPAAVAAALSGELDAHAGLICSASRVAGCGQLEPSGAAIIHDQDRFRVDVFVAPRYRTVQTLVPAGRLPAPEQGVSLATSFSGSLAGSVGASSFYTLQNRTVLGLGTARLRGSSSLSSERDLMLDDLYGEADRANLRYAAGLFWAPGMDFVGQRKLLGAGVSTQFDTRLDKEVIRGNPLIVFLPQPARVDIFRDGQLLTSRSYEAGNQSLDTSGLPDGSYSLVIRIEEGGGTVREERRFFSKNARIPPSGETIYFAFGGLLTEPAANRLVSVSDDIFFEAGVARRLSERVAVSATALGTGDKGMVEIGGVLMTSQAQVRIASLLSTDADYGALLQVYSTGAGILAYNLELRRVQSADGRPLIPSSTLAGGSALGRADSSNGAFGSFTQASANLSFRWGEAQIGAVAAYRSDGRRGTTYTYGPTLFMPILRRNNVQLTLQSELTRSNEGTGGFLRLRLQMLRAPLSLVGAAGISSYKGRGQARRTRAVGQIDGTWQSYLAGHDVTIAAGAERGFEGAGARASADAVGRYGSAHAGVLQALEGGSQTQYSLNLQTGGALAARTLAFGARETAESGIIVGVNGVARGTRFEVLVNDAPRGTISPGERLPIFLTPYARYSVRVRPVDAPQLSFDGGDRIVNLYPGTVQALTWTAETIQTIFGKVVGTDGKPFANADVTSSRGIGRTDPAGYFQVQVGSDRKLSLRRPDGTTCKLEIGTVKQNADYASVGSLVCR